MATVESIARAALGDLAVAEGKLLNAKRWVNDRYADLAATIRLRHLRRLGELTVPAVITAGTVTVTEGSRTVTGDATAAASWSITMTGRFFQIDRVWYRVQTVSGTTMTLEADYAGDTASAQTYRVVARHVLLPDRCRTLVGVIHDRWNREVQQKSLPWLDLQAPERFYQLGGPQCIADLGEDPATRRRLVELYPYSTDTEHLRIAYYEAPLPLDFADELPSTIDQDALKEGVLVDVMRYKMAEAADKGQVDVAALWRNEYRAQETRWFEIKQRMVRTDMVMEDLAWISKSTSHARSGDIVSARDQVWAAGQRP